MFLQVCLLISLWILAHILKCVTFSPQSRQSCLTSDTFRQLSPPDYFTRLKPCSRGTSIHTNMRTRGTPAQLRNNVKNNQFQSGVIVSWCRHIHACTTTELCLSNTDQCWVQRLRSRVLQQGFIQCSHVHHSSWLFYFHVTLLFTTSLPTSWLF